jgi:hypothetical protein
VGRPLVAVACFQQAFPRSVNFLYRQPDPRQTQVPVRGPTRLHSALFHDREPRRIRQRQALILKFRRETHDLRQCLIAKGLDRQPRKRAYEHQEAGGPPCAIPSKEPTMPPATVRAEVMSGDCPSNRLRNRRWYLSDSSRNAMKAEVST